MSNGDFQNPRALARGAVNKKDWQAMQLAWSVYYQLKYSRSMSVQQLQSASTVLELASELVSDDFGGESAKADTAKCAAALKDLAASYGDLDLAKSARVKVKQELYKQFLPLLYWL